MKDEKSAFLGDGWEEIRLRIPKGKYRLVFLDFWNYTADVVGDYDSIEEAKEHMFFPDEYEDFVIYDDMGHVVFDLGNYKPSGIVEDEDKAERAIHLHICGEDVEVVIGNSPYATIVIFLDKTGKFEDLLFEVFHDMKEAKVQAEKWKREFDDFHRIIICNKDGEVVKEYIP